MKLFFEGQKYKTSLLTEWFTDTPFYIKRLRGQQGESTLECVGYYYNASKGEHCFALPKVFFYNGFPFGLKDFADEEWKEGIEVTPSHARDKRFEAWKIDFLYELPLKLYSALDVYSKKQGSKQISEESDLLEVTSSKDKKNLSLLDITFALRDFYQEHEDLFVFIYKESHKGYNKVNWSKTVRKQTPYIDGDNIVYPLVTNRRKEINYEEELLILFFNTLRYIDNTIARVNIAETEYELFPDSEFLRMMKRGVVVRNLLEIQENYYNETLVELWDLLYKFHSKSHASGHGGKKKDDYLLVHKFNIVFEDMIDELLNPYHDEPYQFAQKTEAEKKQDDGKIIDHLFKYESLVVENEKVYYIGDSKYYKDGATPEGSSLYKQYTYAKNIIQSQINWFYEERPVFNKYLKYRDELTEGYTITPNFFITGNVEQDSTWKDDDLKRSANPKHKDDASQPEFVEFARHYQFEDRLFDRDTLFLLQYDINFMFVLNAYVTKNKSKNKLFFDKAKELFKTDFINYIAEQYYFFVLKPKSGTLEDSVNKCFRRVLGKVFSPSNDMLVLALEKENTALLKMQQDLITEISSIFDFYPYKLGEAPEKSLRKILVPSAEYEIKNDIFEGISIAPKNIESLQGAKVLGNTREEFALIGYFKDEDHLKWIESRGKYNRPATWNTRSVKMTLSEIKAKYLILHNESLGNKVYSITSVAPYIMTKEELHSEEGYSPNRHQYYMIYDIDTSCESNEIPQQLFESEKYQTCANKKKPVGIKISKLKEVAKTVPIERLAYAIDEEDTFLGMVAEDEDVY